MNNLRIGILGSGSWASAIAKILLVNNDEIHWYIREPEIIENLKNYGYNSQYLSSTYFDIKKLKLYNTVNELVRNADLIIIVIPSAFLENELKKITVDVSDKFFVNAVKGLIPSENIIVSDYLQKEFKITDKQIASITGPCHAEEVAQERLSYLTIASPSNDLAAFVSKNLNNRFISTITSNDLEGTQWASVMKNIYALAAGVGHGLRYGDNYLAVLISNAAQEMERFLNAINPIKRDIKASAYLGDLLVTAYSQFSRNRTFGNYIGRGYSVQATQAEMLMVAEGYYATKSIYEINQNLKTSMPIVETIYNILYQSKNPLQEFEKLNQSLL